MRRNTVPNYTKDGEMARRWNKVKKGVLEAKLSGKSISVLSRAEYNAIAHDPETIYFITD